MVFQFENVHVVVQGAILVIRAKPVGQRIIKVRILGKVLRVLNKMLVSDQKQGH